MSNRATAGPGARWHIINIAFVSQMHITNVYADVLVLCTHINNLTLYTHFILGQRRPDFRIPS